MENTHYDTCVIGAGISGLSTTAFLLEEQPEQRVLLLEQSDTAGGAISSFAQDGYLAEWGPHGFLDNCEESRRLVTLAGLDGERELAPLGEFVRYVCLDGRLRCIPQTPLKVLREPLIPLSAKLRVLGELWQGPLSGEPSVAQWVEHRFGKALLPFADAAFTGTYAGDVHRLKIDAVMAGVRELEGQHGSVLRGLARRFCRRRAAAKECEGEERGGRCGKGRGLPAMTSFSSGMGRLPQALAEQLAAKVSLRYNTEVTAIKKSDQGWEVSAAGHRFCCRDLVLALPVNRSLALINQVEGLAPPPRLTIPEARLATVLLGFDQAAEIPFGFGYLAPESEQRYALGALFSSHMFPGRAPAGHQLMEVLVGGRRHPERLAEDDDTLINQVYRDLGQLMHLPKAPCLRRVLRPRAGIPQLEEGYTQLLSWRRQLMAAEAGLHLCGFGWKGIGLNDMIKEGQRMAGRIAERQGDEGQAELKGVYF
ncbi:protoporphyrinogen oxidase [Desulfogranum mediterraneum]|uniref:protoporphyrinogen oxidase n=1 Tax=Desulfogranum mediterraneum TaxID=160661 RepID=UPI0003FD60F8|nr:protoporphyrinogen oxidase [Desulfogranum mediterraneum]